MPRRRSPPTLVSHSLSVICSWIEWFSVRYCQFDCLTSDVLVQIFNRLKAIPGLTAQHFQLVLTDYINRIDLSSPYQNDGGINYIDVALDIIRSRQPNLIYVNLSNVLQVPDVFWFTIIPTLAHLRVLNLRSTNCGDQEVLTIVQHCHHLRELDLSLCERVTNWSISQLCLKSGGLQLEHLDVMQTQVDERGIRSIVQHCSTLRSLKWRNTINVFAQIYRDISGASTSSERTYNFNIHQLISDSSYRLHSLQGAAQLCRHASQVTIDGPSKLIANDLQALEHLHCLRELHIVLGRYSNPEFHPDFRQGFETILVRHGSNLRHLSLGRIHNVDLHRIAHHCRQLLSLSLELNHSYQSDENIPIYPVQSLVKLSIFVRDHEPSDADEFIRDVPQTCLVGLISSPTMRHIKITACQTVNDQTLFSCVNGRDLENLELESCSNVSMQSLWFIMGRSKCLTSLKLYRCRLVKDNDIAQLDKVIGEQRWDLCVDYYSDSST